VNSIDVGRFRFGRFFLRGQAASAVGRAPWAVLSGERLASRAGRRLTPPCFFSYRGYVLKPGIHFIESSKSSLPKVLANRNKAICSAFTRLQGAHGAIPKGARR